MKQRSLFWTFITIVPIVAILPSGCMDQATRTTTTESKQQRVCGVIDGAFRNRWWNFLERAQSFATCQRWTEAEADLRAAIEQRSDDQRRARTYGMHFVDYFPHRELGIILYRQNRLMEAIRELETSLSTEKSSKAELYLDKVRSDWIQHEGLDKLPPSITIDKPSPGALVQGFALHVQGVARDDTFVKSIQVNGNPVRIDLAAARIAFDVEVKLGRNQNHIAILATDLAGRVTQHAIQIYADREGPTVGIQEAQPGSKIAGYVEDPSGLAEVRVNGTRQQISSIGALNLDTALPKDKSSVLIEAIDKAGNFTVAKLDFTERFNWHWQEPPLLLAALDGATVGDLNVATTEGVTLNYRSESGDIFLEHIYLEGQAKFAAGVASVRVNTVELVRRPGKRVFFSHRIALASGANHLRLEVVDTAGRSIVRELILIRKLKQLEQRQARYRLSLATLFAVDVAVTQALWQSIEDTPRFFPIGSGVIATGSLAKPLTTQDAARLARVQNADGVLVTEIHHHNNALEYSAQWVDAVNGKTIFTADAYAETDVDPHFLAMSLMRKAKDALPVLDGEVKTFKDAALTVEILDAKNIPENIPVILYRPAPGRTDAVTGADLGSDQIVLGTARLGISMAASMFAAHVEGTANLQPCDKVQIR